MANYDEQELITITKKLYESARRKIFLEMMVRANIGTYPWWDFSKSAREARAKKKALWEENKQEIESMALEDVMKGLKALPDATRERILRELRSY